MTTDYKVSFKTENVNGTGNTKSKTVSGLVSRFAENQNTANTAARAWEPLFGTAAETIGVTNIVNEAYDTSQA